MTEQEYDFGIPMVPEHEARTIHTYPPVNPYNDVTQGRVIGWWSGGVASAVACFLSLEKWGSDVELVFCDTALEHPDTYRFMADYENKLGVKIKRIKSERFGEPEDVWHQVTGLNFAHGAPCSMYLKKYPRIKYQKLKTDFCQIFGFDYDGKEMRRATNMLTNNPDLNPVFPLIINKLNREKIFAKIKDIGIEPPSAYKHFLNNNCIGADDSPKGGCIQGGIGYWQKIQRLYPKKFDYMSEMEHKLSRKKGQPVTICKDQRKDTKGARLFLKVCSDFPDVESIAVIKGLEPITPFECNGFCSTDEQV